MTTPTVTPAVQFRPWRTGANGTAPVAGDGGFQPLVPIDEPLSVGAPPVTPALVAAMNYTDPTHRTAVRSGWVRTRPAGGSPRPTFRVSWRGLSKTERDSLLDWFAGTVRWTLLAFDVEVDGPGTGAVRVRAVVTPVDRLVARAGDGDTDGVYEIDVDVEEVWG
ncbi:MAG: hypothetical protein WAZ94_13485 [Phycisphaerales bacterium]